MSGTLCAVDEFSSGETTSLHDHMKEGEVPNLVPPSAQLAQGCRRAQAVLFLREVLEGRDGQAHLAIVEWDRLWIFLLSSKTRFY